jgi:hypothetical protein
MSDKSDLESERRRVEAIHPHWRGFLLLSDADGTVTHETVGSTGTFSVSGDRLKIAWHEHPAEDFVEMSGVWIQETILANKPSQPSSGETAVAPLRLGAKKTAVITDATSAEFYFPRWRNYYGALFGQDNLYIVTYAGKQSLFRDAGIKNIWEINAAYDDALRVKVIADLTAALLNSYDVVLHCDVDEFLVPNPTQYSDLSDYIDKNPHPYVTAQGIDIVETADDAPLRPDEPVLCRQRRYAMRATSLNKTALLTTPIRWSPGFHGANVVPHFSNLYNFHLKWADLKGRIAWHEWMMASLEPGTFEYKYFAVGAEHLINFQKFLTQLPRTGLETDDEFNRNYLDAVTHNTVDDIFAGPFTLQNSLFAIDEKFAAPGLSF